MDALDLSAGRKARAAAPARQQPAASEHVGQLAASERRARWTTRTLNWLLVPLSLVLGVLGWQWLVVARNIPPFILPPPTRVATRFASVFADGNYVVRSAYWNNGSLAAAGALTARGLIPPAL